MTSLFTILANNGAAVQNALLTQLDAKHNIKTLKDFGVEEAALMIGITPKHLRDQEAAGVIPQPRRIQSGTVEKRQYSLKGINDLRTWFGKHKNRPKRAFTVVFTSLKGGCGKSTEAVHFAQYAALQGYRTLLIDTDPQGTATGAFGYIPDSDLSSSDTVLAALDDPTAIRSIIRQTYWDRLDLIPAQLGLQEAETRLRLHGAIHLLSTKFNVKFDEDAIKNIPSDEVTRLRSAIDGIAADYDIVVIDTPPAVGMLSINATMAADHLVIPMTPSMHDYSSSIQCFRVMDALCGYLQPPTESLSIMLTRHDEHSQSCATATSYIRAAYNERVMVHPMVQSVELQRDGMDQCTLYEIAQPRGGRAAFSRALDAMNAVNKELLDTISSQWGRLKNET